LTVVMGHRVFGTTQSRAIVTKRHRTTAAAII
jgi:hypothetical protein